MRKSTKILLLGFLILILLGGYYLANKTILPPDGDFIEKEVEVKIKSGSSVKTIANLLYEEGVIKNVNDFILTAKIFRLGSKLKAGKYKFPVNLSNYKVLKILVQGHVAEEKVIIPEGYTARQIASLLQKKIEVDSMQFMQLTTDENFINQLGFQLNSLEGYLYPNTYNFYWGMKPKKVITRLVKQFNYHFNDSLKQHAKDKGWTVHQIVTLASIIEGEAMVDSERSTISAVYHNRLKRRMLLQADPTIQYIIPDGPRRLLKRDLAIDSPYNTYKYTGLPPGPVNNPGIKSIIAAIDPAPVSYLYFVAKGDGSHIFSQSLKQHLNAKRKFDQYRREVKRKEYDQKGSR